MNIPFEIEIEVTDWETGRIVSRFIKKMEVDRMSTSKVRAACTREFNKALKKYADTNFTVVGNFHGQMQEPPYTMSSGLLSGVKGKIMARRGQYDL